MIGGVRATLAAVAVIAGGLTAGATPARAQPAEDKPTPTAEAPQRPIRPGRLDMRGLVIDTRHGKEPALPSGLRSADSGGEQLQLVQFRGPVQRTWVAGLRDLGADIVAPLSPYGYIVQADAETVAAIESWQSKDAAIRWTGPFRPAYRLAPDLTGTQAPAADETVDVYVQVPAGDTAARAEARSLGEPVANVMTLAGLDTLTLRVTGADLAYLARQSGVVNVERKVAPQMMDEAQDQLLAGNVNTTPDGRVTPSGPGYLQFLADEGVSTDPASHPVVAVVDDGVDDGTTNPLHDVFRIAGVSGGDSRVVFAVDCTSPGSPVGNDGHGNINAGIIAGFNDATGGLPHEDAAGYNFGLGVDPYARLSNVKVFSDGGRWNTSNCSDTVEGIAQEVADSGAVISNNSWGGGVRGAYDIDAQSYDALIRDSSSAPGAQPILHVFSAGNSGPGDATIGSPGAAKNVLTVGATENVRDQGVLDGCGESDGDNAADMATFSSRGPTLDLRAKPDIVASGTHVQGPASLAPGYNGDGTCDKYYPAGQTLYTWSSGTSHSAPAVTGAAALAYEYYERSVDPGVAPSPAMMKALLLNSSRYLDGSDTGGTLPGTGQGWGNVDVGAMIDPTRWVLDQSRTFTTSGQMFSQSFTVADPASPTRVTMAFSDAPGSTVGASWVNDLDLTVVADGVVYKGNVFSGAQSTSGGSADPRNNVEQVWLPAGISGPVTVHIAATNIAGDGVPGGRSLDQDFALTAVNLTATAPTTQPAVLAVTFAENSTGSNANGSIEPGEWVAPTVTLANYGSVDADEGALTAQILDGPADVIDGAFTTEALPTGTRIVDGPRIQVRPTADCADIATVRFTYQAGAHLDSADVQFSTHLPPGAPWTTIPSSDVPKPVPDLATATSTLTAASPRELAGLRVGLDVSHTWVADLSIMVTGPLGQTSTLVSERGGGGANFTGTVFDDWASSTISTGRAPFTGSFRPETPLSVFAGTSAEGEWTLAVTDLAEGDDGTLNSWEIQTQDARCAAVYPGVRAEDVPAATPEGEPLLFPVTRVGPTTDPVVVEVHTADGTAEAGKDYTAVATEVTIPAGQTDAAVSVPTLGDSSSDGGETVQLVVSSASGFASILRSLAVGVISDAAPTPSSPKQAQTATVKVPKKVKFSGKTVLLKKAVVTNAGQKAIAKVTVRPKGTRYASVRTSPSGKVTLKTFGKSSLKLRLGLDAPATTGFDAYTFRKTWRVKRSLRHRLRPALTRAQILH